MDVVLECPLCGKSGYFFITSRNVHYYRCSGCNSVFMASSCHLNYENEKIRYDQHNNDVHNPGYRKFVKPMVDKIKEEICIYSKGLDYGAGPGPVATVLLKESGYQSIALYDPFYWPDRNVLKKQYNFIICCEVIEHFRNPAQSFKLLRSLMLPGGSLYCMTVIYEENIDFHEWYYKNDPTHVFFYHPKALSFIENEYNFSSYFIEGRLICYKA